MPSIVRSNARIVSSRNSDFFPDRNDVSPRSKRPRSIPAANTASKLTAVSAASRKAAGASAVAGVLSKVGGREVSDDTSAALFLSDPVRIQAERGVHGHDSCNPFQ